MGMLYLLDTNVLSEAARPRPNAALAARLERELEAGSCATCAIVLYELYRGALLHSDPLRSAALLEFAQEWRAMIPVLPYEEAATYWQADESVRLQRLGRPITLDDAQIAACAVANDLTLVTRNTRHFEVFRTLRLEDWFA